MSEVSEPDAWIEAHLKPHLKQNVPREVASLFEVARGSMIYGWFFYPLITLGAEQCYRVLEAAARKRCEQAGIPTQRPTKKGKMIDTKFVDNIDSLIKVGIIAAADSSRWDVTRKLRKIASHPDSQTILAPGTTIGLLVSPAGLLNNLYG